MFGTNVLVKESCVQPLNDSLLQMTLLLRR